MALRKFMDERGRHWTVWDVYPTLAERRLRNTGPPGGLTERRCFHERRPRIRASLSQGWLSFESRDGERRRLAPIPETPQGWERVSDEELQSWCAKAQPAPPPRRLIE